VETKSGLCVGAELAVVGVGVLPNVDFLADSGLALDNGVLVDQRFETQAPGVFAAGDVANFFDPLYGRQRRIEHWSNANYQGTEVGKVLAGSGSGYDTVSSFFSEVFGTTVKVFGDVSRFDELTTEGSLASGTLLSSYGESGRLVGALTVGASDELEALLKDLIAEHAPIDAVERELVGGRSR
jgi:3-phenylpropionate/trans-cinnamate dioxygenase ferredoxin reductase component